MDFKQYIEELSKLYAVAGAALRLSPGSSNAALDLTESELGFALDESIRGAWLEADGGHEWCPIFARPDYLTGYDFLSIEQALRARTNMRSRSPNYEGYEAPEPRDTRIKPGWFQDGWLPFGSFSGSTLLLIQDYSPSDIGQRGQIIAFNHDPDTIEYVTSSFASLLAASIKSIADDPTEFIVLDE
jgi:cell wall assembly regulator SMI1